MPDPHFCNRHTEQIADLDKRTTALELIIGESSAEGLRAEMGKLSVEVAKLTLVIQEQRLAEAKRDGRLQGATWLARLIWAVFGAGALAFFSDLFETFRNSPHPHQ